LIFVDTTIWVAAIDKKDELHNDGKATVNAIVANELPLAVVTDYVLDEVMTILKRRGVPVRQIVDSINAIIKSPRVEVVFIDDSLFVKGLIIFSKYEKLSFTDATTLAVMQKYKIKEIYSHDSDFDFPKIIRHKRPE